MLNITQLIFFSSILYFLAIVILISERILEEYKAKSIPEDQIIKRLTSKFFYEFVLVLQTSLYVPGDIFIVRFVASLLIVASFEIVLLKIFDMHKKRFA